MTKKNRCIIKKQWQKELNKDTQREEDMDENRLDDLEGCPHQKQQVAVDYERDKVYEGIVICNLNDKWCLLDTGMECDTWKEIRSEEKEND